MKDIIENKNHNSSLTEKLALWIKYFWIIIFFLAIARWIIDYINSNDNYKEFSVFAGLFIGWFVYLFCRWIYKIIMLWVNNRKRNAELTAAQEARINNNPANPETGQSGLSFDLIPQDLYEPYTKIKNSWFRLFESTTNAQVRTWYVNSISRDNKDREEEATHALYIEHQFPDKKLNIDAFVHIKPDIRENNRSSFIASLSWPWIILYILFKSKNSEKLFSNIESQGIQPWIFLIVILLFSAYISYLIHKKMTSHNAVKLENRGFEKTFDVNSNDNIVARQVCNPILISELQDRLIKNNLNTYSEIYIDFKLNRLIYKFDYNIVDNSWLLSDDYVKICIALTNEMIDRISIIRNMAVVYAGRVAIDRVKETNL